ncbi:unnamed protein product [Orchesella dallaii]|uniref:F-box domain-containing protein n=1 Tax=Orchesella dallaii TaxID=48710 RepID=A0ABP1RIT4_9HEXA
MESQSYEEAGTESSTNNDVSFPPNSRSDDPLSIFSPEVLDQIFEFLRNDRKSLLKCRQINTFWRAATDSYLERACLSNWTTWRPSTTVDLLKPFPVLPFAPYRHMNKGKNNSTICNFVYCPKELLRHQRNPFPTRSLTLSKLPDMTNIKENDDTSAWRVTPRFLRKFGAYLTSLVIHDTLVSMSQLENMLVSLVNLRALTFSKVKKVEELDIFEASPENITISSKLTHFRALENVSPDIVQWFISLSSQQLISLEVDASNLKSFRRKKSILNESETIRMPPVFNKLKYLKIYNPLSNFLQFPELNCFQIKHLSIICKHFECDILYVLEVSSFVEKFSSTLTHLHLDVHFRIGLKLMERNFQTFKKKEEGITFPNLTQFGFRCPISVFNEDAPGILLRREFLSKCPHLERLHLLPRVVAREHPMTQTMYVDQKEQYLKLCPKLKSFRYGEVRIPI